jgi:stage V sporulation protein G
MKITNVKITLKTEEKLKGFAVITIDDSLVIRGLRIISGKNGYFVSMPSKQDRDGNMRDICHPINNETRMIIENAVLDAYEERVNLELQESGV